MTQIIIRLFVVVWVVLGFVPSPVFLGLSGARIASAQRIADPGFGDPTALGVNASNPGALSSGFNNAPGFQGSYGPTAPLQPGTAMRPSTWPGGPGLNPTPTAKPGQAGVRVATALPRMTAPLGTPADKKPGDPPYDPAEILARIGSEVIQASELLPMINKAIENNVIKPHAAELAKLEPEERERELNKIRREYMRQATKEVIKTKLVIAEVKGRLPKDKLETHAKKIRDIFNSTYITELRKDYGVSSVIELEDRLRELGGSLDSQRTMFLEQQLSSSWIGQAVKKEDKEPTHEEMVAYYRDKGSDWETPARVRWEQLTAKFVNFDSKPEAHAAMVGWGNDIWLRGVPFAEVAKAHSQEFAADAGGVHDWASRGSLRSTAIEDSLFALPIGSLSQIIEDEEGFHIVRVIERQEASKTPFGEVQPEIKKRLHDGGEKKRRQDYIENLRKTTPVWTVFDEDPAGPPYPDPTVKS